MIRPPPSPTLFPSTPLSLSRIPPAARTLATAGASSSATYFSRVREPDMVRTPRVRSKSLIETRSEEHTSELQSRLHLVCRLLLEKKNRKACDIHVPSVGQHM